MVNGASFSGRWRFSEVNIQMEAYKMKIEYNRLFEKLKSENITQKTFKENAKISSTTLVKMLHNESITTETICRICDYFHCMPDEIMEFIPEIDYPEKIKAKQQAKAELEAQIAELQEKLKNL